jgi:ABC-type spermidine/putrescine transport system permease subunit I
MAVQLSSEPDSPASATPARRRRRFGLRASWHLLALPGVAWTTLFFLAPMALLLVYSFGSVNLLDLQVQFGWTFSNYTGIFQKLYLDPILRSFALSAAATIACLLIGFPVALRISRATGRRQAVLMLAVMIPFWTSFVVRTYGIYDVIADNGPLYSLLHALGLVHGYIHILYTVPGIGIGIVYTYLPLMVLPLFVSLERIDSSLLEAAGDLGATPLRTLRKVILPLATPGIIAGCILVAIPATGEYVIPQILGGDKTLMFGNVVADIFEDLGNYPFGAALTIALTVVLMVVLVFLRSRSYKAEEAVS